MTASDTAPMSETNDYESYTKLRVSLDFMQDLAIDYLCDGVTAKEEAQRYRRLREILQPCIDELKKLQG